MREAVQHRLLALVIFLLLWLLVPVSITAVVLFFKLVGWLWMWLPAPIVILFKVIALLFLAMVMATLLLEYIYSKYVKDDEPRWPL